MFIVPCIMCFMDRTVTLGALFGIIIYAVQIVMIIILIYRLGCYASERARYKMELRDDPDDEEERLNRQLAGLDEEEKLNILIKREEKKNGRK